MRTILFDLDETLLDRAGSFENYIESQYRRHQLEHIAYETYRDRFIELDGRGYTDRQKVFEALIDEFTLSLSVEELLADFRQNAWKNCQTFADTAEVLRELRLRDYKLGIITNGSVESQSVKLSVSGLDSLVDVVLISEQERLKKPDPAIFTRAAERLGVGASKCVFVGDNLEIDVGGARSAGMKTIWFKNRQIRSADLTIVPDYIISSLTEVLSIEF